MEVAVCALPIIPPGGISCQQKSFRSVIYFSVLIRKAVFRTSFVLKNESHFENQGVSLEYFHFCQGTSRIFILIFPQTLIFILASTSLLELDAIRLEPIIYYLYSTNAANLLWARLDKSPALDYNIKKTDFLSDTASLK